MQTATVKDQQTEAVKKPQNKVEDTSVNPGHATSIIATLRLQLKDRSDELISSKKDAEDLLAKSHEKEAALREALSEERLLKEKAQEDKVHIEKEAVKDRSLLVSLKRDLSKVSSALALLTEKSGAKLRKVTDRRNQASKRAAEAERLLKEFKAESSGFDFNTTLDSVDNLTAAQVAQLRTSLTTHVKTLKNS